MSMQTIYPYLVGHTWVFDDPRTRLKEEAFVLGMSEMISRLVEVKGIPNAANGVMLQFDSAPFAGADAELRWFRSGDPEVLPGKDGSASHICGNWYEGDIAGRHMQGWLCPALGLYFQAAPARIFVKAEPLPAGVDPRWRVDHDASDVLRFVSAAKA
jgi:hypothetical protein